MQLLEVINEFVVNDINKTIDFYSKYLNFEIVETDGKPITWIKMKKNNVTIMFETYEAVCKEINNYTKKTETSNIIKFKYNNKEIVNKLYNIICNNNIEIFMPLEEKPYGSIEFGIFDPDKNLIIISSN